VIATASPRSAARVEAAGAHETIDHTGTDVVDAVAEPVDVLLNLARIDADELARLATVVRRGGVVVNSVPTIPTPDDEERGVRGVGVFVRSDTARLTELVAMVDRGELHVHVGERVALEDLPGVHARDDAGEAIDKVVVVVDPAAA
jgi:NADPH:quinone reductase-like Zn-dependent oxidoreductase